MSHRETWLGPEQRAKPLVRAGMILGLGLGGFFDGIVFHQILLELNVFADGLT